MLLFPIKLINTTPVGMSPQVENSPVDASLMNQLPDGSIAYDLIYTPNPTRFLQLAQQQGAITINGLEMLVQQGASALRIWLQQPVPIDTMRIAINTNLSPTSVNISLNDRFALFVIKLLLNLEKLKLFLENQFKRLLRPN